MTNAEWLIQNKIPFKNINLHVDNIHQTANIYINDYEKIEYDLILDDLTQEEIESKTEKAEHTILLVSTFSILRVLEGWLDSEADETLFVKKILSTKEKSWLVNLIKPFYKKIEHLRTIEVMRHVKDEAIEDDLNCIQITYVNTIFDSDGNPNGTGTFRQTIEMTSDSDICSKMVADEEYPVTTLGLGFNFDFESDSQN